MRYTPLTKLAMKLAYAAHRDQTDKSGMPYIYHPIHLAEQMTTETEICVALLHDVVEDTHINFDTLAQAGFPDAVLDALRLMTHDDATPYMDYVLALRQNPVARTLKLADLRHNSDLTRLDIVDDAALRRVEKYHAAIELLSLHRNNRSKYFR